MLKTCKNCGRQFEATHHNMRYCSEQCRRQCNRKRYSTQLKNEKACIVCGKKFETNRSHQITCGAECRSEMKRKRAIEMARKRYQAKPKVKITCRFCGKEFEGGKHRKYCSAECISRARAKKDGQVESLCWTCIHAVPSPEKGTGCIWSRSCGKIPVEGSEYVERVVSYCNGSGRDTKTLRIMTMCPKYKWDTKARW